MALLTVSCNASGDCLVLESISVALYMIIIGVTSRLILVHETRYLDFPNS
jgi:hypothetical protein